MVLIPLLALLAAAPSGVDAWRAHRVGLFVHWGVATGRALPQSHSHARQSGLNPSGSVPAALYDEFYKEFNPTAYDPDALLRLAHAAGMRYAVFVAKHHDGFSMYQSAANPYNVMATPYGKDVARQFAEACRRQGLALGWQLSPKDWKHPDFHTASHERYNAYYEKVVAELATQYGPLTTMWFDGTEPIEAAEWKSTPQRVADYLHRVQPGIVLSNHGGGPEDFVSFEALVGPFDRVQPWEMAEAINPSGWVFNKPMPARPFRELLRNMVYTIARDGNYLLDVGPRQDGTLHPPDAERLGEFAAWMKPNAEAVHGTRGGPYRDGDWGGATCKGRFVYLFVSDRVGGTLTLPALGAKVRSVRRLDGGAVRYSRAGRGGWRFDLSGARAAFTVVRVELDREAFGLPVVDGQANLATAGNTVASSVRGGFPVGALFDNLGDTAWDAEAGDAAPSLTVDLGVVRAVRGVSFSQRSQRLSWHQYYRYEVSVRDTAEGEWRNVYKGHSCLGGVPVLELDGVRGRYVRVEIRKPRASLPVELAEFRVFGE